MIGAARSPHQPPTTSHQPLMNDLLQRTRAWISADPDPSTRAELEALVELGEMDELAERMDGTLAFGTAGIRGVVEAGSNRMNRASVIRTTKGLADFLLERHSGVPPGPVVVGRDARLSSLRFMRDTVGVLAAAGLPVRFWPQEVPTPLVAYAVAELGACAGVMITASHNPPRDNGYKVYDSNGAQIIPPVDSGIAAAIERAGAATDVPRIGGTLEGSHPEVVPIQPEIWRRYRLTLARLRFEGAGDPSLRIVYTPLHGVGWRFVREVFEEAGYVDLHPVRRQMEPDGSFPTVAFPNPEEPGALDLALSLAERVGADLVLANDPDADRLAVAVPGPEGWHSLTGNQVGALLGDYVLSHRRDGARPLIINSIVSSPMAGVIASAHGARFETTLTGFKWIANAALEVDAGGEATFEFGYEEALGYSVGSAVRDKDGVSAALIVADLAAECRRDGLTLRDRLADLYRCHGLWVSVQRSIRRPGSTGLAAIAQAMADLGSTPPGEVAGIRVVATTDYRVGAGERPGWLGATPLISLDLENGSRVLVRPSGTEPKLKIYVDAHVPVPGASDPFALEEPLVEQAEEVAAALAGSLGI